jgi:hypothetical protein
MGVSASRPDTGAQGPRIWRTCGAREPYRRGRCTHAARLSSPTADRGMLGRVIRRHGLQPERVLDWAKRYDGPAHGDDGASALRVSSDGSTVFVTGYSAGSNQYGSDYLTVAYDAATGTQVWVKRYDGPAHETDVPSALGVSPDPRTDRRRDSAGAASDVARRGGHLRRVRGLRSPDRVRAARGTAGDQPVRRGPGETGASDIGLREAALTAGIARSPPRGVTWIL